MDTFVDRTKNIIQDFLVLMYNKFLISPNPLKSMNYKYTSPFYPKIFLSASKKVLIRTTPGFNLFLVL